MGVCGGLRYFIVALTLSLPFNYFEIIFFCFFGVVDLGHDVEAIFHLP